MDVNSPADSHKRPGDIPASVSWVLKHCHWLPLFSSVLQGNLQIHHVGQDGQVSAHLWWVPACCAVSVCQYKAGFVPIYFCQTPTTAVFFWSWEKDTEALTELTWCELSRAVESPGRLKAQGPALSRAPPRAGAGLFPQPLGPHAGSPRGLGPHSMVARPPGDVASFWELGHRHTGPEVTMLLRAVWAVCVLLWIGRTSFEVVGREACDISRHPRWAPCGLTMSC